MHRTTHSETRAKHAHTHTATHAEIRSSNVFPGRLPAKKSEKERVVEGEEKRRGGWS